MEGLFESICRMGIKSDQLTTPKVAKHLKKLITYELATREGAKPSMVGNAIE